MDLANLFAAIICISIFSLGVGIAALVVNNDKDVEDKKNRELKSAMDKLGRF